jgi:Methyltransferase domain/C-methyltransferase C-terminal domain
MKEAIQDIGNPTHTENARLACPSCGHGGVEVFYGVNQVPVHSVLLLPTRDEAIRYPKGDIALGFCRACGMIANVVFDPSVHEYSTRYEETQGFSQTFQDFHQGLAGRLVQKFDIHNKQVIEIGCGKGEFLTMVCDIGNNRGIGFDPAYVSERNQSKVKDRITFIQDFYSEKYSGYHGDVVICKMTLEHILDTGDFMETIRRSIGDRKDTIVFFMIPEVRRILKERAFWDIYYEHCSYFSKGSLARLFRRSGFDVLALGTEYDDQYLTIEARPSMGHPVPPHPEEDDIEVLRREVEDFRRTMDTQTAAWKALISGYQQDGKRVVIWGGGSKGVAFLTKLGIGEEIPYAVDVNPYKHGSFMAGTGQEIISPEFLKTYKPDIVIVMNPIYRGEVQAELDRMKVAASVIPITEL